MGEGFGDGRLGDLVEDHPLGALGLDLGRFHQVPGNGLAFAVGVGRQVDLGGVLRQLLELLDHRPLLIGHAVLGREIVLHIHRELRAQQVAHVPDRGLDGVALAQETPHRAGLGRRFDDHQLALAVVTLLGGDHPLMGGGVAHAEQGGAAHRAGTTRSRRAIIGKDRLSGLLSHVSSYILHNMLPK